MKTLSITALLAAIIVVNTAQAHGPRHRQNRNIGNEAQQILSLLEQLGVIKPSRNNNNTNNNSLSITGTWNETLNGFPIQHTMFANGFHKITDPVTGATFQEHQAQFDGRDLQLLNGTYRVTAVSPGVLRLTNLKFAETRTWTQVNTNSGGGFGSGGNGGGGVQNVGIPQHLQGIWYAVSPEGTRWVYVLRANAYDMFDIEPATNLPVMDDDGQPVQLISHNLTYVNDILTLSPGQDVADGPFTMHSHQGELHLEQVSGGAERILTRTPQN